MSNVLDYVKNTAHQSLEDLPLTELDIAVLNELAYLPLSQGQEEALEHSFLPLTDIVALAPEDSDDKDLTFMRTKNRLALLEAVLSSQRYQGLRFGHYINDVDSLAEKQFAAVVAHLPEQDYYQLIFRGTDETLIGWKEDFNMTYLEEIPAQTAACDYLTAFLTQNPVALTVSGHSKGGNLAVFAASSIAHNLQEHLEAVYILDAPGLQDSVLETSGYQQIRHKIKAYKPHESIVGVMLSSDVASVIVESQQNGILQHDLFNWQIQEHAFSPVPELSHLSQSLQGTFDQWMAEYSKSELKSLSDAFFDIFFSLGIEDLDRLTDIDFATVKALLGKFQDLDDKKKVLLFDALKNLLGIYHQNSLSIALDSGKAKWQEWVEKLQDNFNQFLP